jgi:predicted Zn-dependent protease
MAAEMARALTVLDPGNPFGWIDWAYSLYELNRIQEARNVLLSVVNKFPNEYLMRYSLACYACQLGDLKDAFQWLETAVHLANEKEAKQMVLNNPDLQPLWDQIGEI